MIRGVPDLDPMESGSETLGKKLRRAWRVNVSVHVYTQRMPFGHVHAMYR